jgi:hypothetical protein
MKDCVVQHINRSLKLISYHVGLGYSNKNLIKKGRLEKEFQVVTET